MSGVIETWSLGVELELFGRDDGFEKLLHWVRKGLGTELAHSAADLSLDVDEDEGSSSGGRSSVESDGGDGRDREGWS